MVSKLVTKMISARNDQGTIQCKTRLKLRKRAGCGTEAVPVICNNQDQISFECVSVCLGYSAKLVVDI